MEDSSGNSNSAIVRRIH
ncbi:hypothetical protein Goari_000571, partial [Gossypium aridum]|nr:hypothetical protein [Gossypium aridum]